MLIATCYLLLAAYYLLLATYYSLLVPTSIPTKRLTTYDIILTPYTLLLTTSCSPLPAHHFLPTTPCLPQRAPRPPSRARAGSQCTAGRECGVASSLQERRHHCRNSIPNEHQGLGHCMGGGGRVRTSARRVCACVGRGGCTGLGGRKHCIGPQLNSAVPSY